MPISRSAFASFACFASLCLPVAFVLPSVAQGDLQGDKQTTQWVNDRGRRVSSLDEDLVQTLLREARLDEAKWVCQWEISGRIAGQFEHAIWTARLGHVLAEEESRLIFRNGSQKGQQLAKDAATRAETASRSLEQILRLYPDANASTFLKAEKLKIRQHLLRSAILAASVSPLTPETVDELLSGIASLQGDAQRLSEDATRLMIERSNGSRIDEDAFSFKRLISELALQRISLAVMQSELFEEGGSDYVAAAADAVTLANKLMPSLPDNTASKLSARLMLAESMLRSGDLRGAGQLVTETYQALGVLPAAWMAVEVRRQLTLGQTKTAEQLAQSFYGTRSPTASSPTSPEMDDAWLRVLLAQPQANESIAAWFETVEKRGGAFARRRAEAIALRQMRSDSSQRSQQPAKSGLPKIDPALVAAQGADWLRRGDANRAGRLLLAAALAESQYSIAAGYGAKAAAAFSSMRDTMAAIQSLQVVANRFPKEPEAAALMLQAAVMASEKSFLDANPNEAFGLLETLLGQTCRLWPKTDQAMKASQWRCDLLTKTDRPRDAAYAALEHFTRFPTSVTLDRALDHWFDWLITLDQATVDEELASLTLAIQDAAKDTAEIRKAIRVASCWLFDRDRLSVSLPDAQTEGSVQSFFLRLGKSRASNLGELSAGGVSGQTLRRARWRLTRDGFKNPDLQSSVGRILIGLADASEWENAGAALWANPSSDAIQSISDLANQSPVQIENLQQGIQWLVSTRSNDAKRAAVKLSDRLAGLVPQRSEPWYAAKLQSIEWLSELGEKQESQKRAKYVLLVASPSDPELRKQFERYGM